MKPYGAKPVHEIYPVHRCEGKKLRRSVVKQDVKHDIQEQLDGEEESNWFDGLWTDDNGVVRCICGDRAHEDPRDCVCNYYECDEDWYEYERKREFLKLLSNDKELDTTFLTGNPETYK